MDRGVNVIMLPTKDKKAPINLGSDNKELFLANGLSLNHQHLYFLSDEEIKNIEKVDINKPLMFISSNGVIKIITYANKRVKTPGSYYEIIATTDSELTITLNYYTPVIKKLPRPSNSFLQKYVEEWNKGNIIEKVLVEYEVSGWGEKLIEFFDEPEIFHIKLKVAPDNTITIKPIVETWENIFDSFISTGKMGIFFKQWLEENYNPPTKKK